MFKLTLERQISLAFIVAIVLLIVISLFTFQSTNSIDEAVKWEKHTQEVLLGLDELLLSTVDAETSSRGYATTGNDLFLEPFTVAEKEIPENVKTLQVLLEDNPAQLEKLEKLRLQISEKILYLKQAVAIRQEQGINAAIELANKGRGKALMDQVRITVGEMKTEEKKFLEIREENLSKSISQTNRMLILGVIAGIIAVGLANLAIFRETGKRRQAENLLKDTNKNLETKIKERTREVTQKNDELVKQFEITNVLDQRRQIALEAGNLGMWTFNPLDKRVEMDDRSLMFFGLEKKTFDGDVAKVFSVVHKEDFPAIKELFEKSIKEVNNFNAEFRVLMPDGSIRWNHCIGQPQLDENGEVKNMIGFCRDITDYKNHENILLERENFTRAILDSLSAHIAVIDKNGVIIAINKAWEEFSKNNCIAGQENLTGVGQNYMSVSENGENFDEETKAIGQNFRAVLNGEKTEFTQEYPCHSPSDKRWFMLQVNALQNKDGGAVVSHINITDRKIAEESLKQSEEFSRNILQSEQSARRDAEIANRLRDEFLATVSHELRAPLNSILGWSKLMQQGKLDETTAKKALETIIRNANSQNRLIEDLLDVSRIISGKLRLEIIQIQPSIFVEAAMESVRPSAEAKNILLEIKEDTAISHISGDPNRLQQVIWNLLSNAIKFTPSGGTVSVDIQRIDGNIEIKVKDTGAGIKKEFLPHVFERFRQADASSIRKFGGLGLGLAIVRHITEMHGGTVSVESAGEDQGTTFKIKLPVTVTSEEEFPDSETNLNGDFLQTEVKLHLDGLLILIVDDETDVRQLLVQALTPFGATVTTASSAEEALTEISLKNPDIIVSDIGMPDEDGYSLMRKVRQLPDEKANIPAIALTAFSRAQDRTRALAAGFQSHVAKPLELEELVTVIASLTGRLQITENDEA